MFTWIEKFADWLVLEVFTIDPSSWLSASLSFFIYDSIKILVLLIIIIFLMGIVNSYFPTERVKNFITGKKWYGFEFLIASLFGVVTPFCSCSSVPLFIGFVRAGIPLGVTLSFLITSPLVNEVAIGLFIGLFGLQTTILYVIGGVILGTISGMVLHKFKLEKLLTPWTLNLINSNATTNGISTAIEQESLLKKLPFLWSETVQLLKSITPYVIVGIAIGAIIHGLVPEDFFAAVMHKKNPIAVPLATIIAVPFYTNASGILPIVQVLVEKGVPIGTALAFMMGVVGLSLPEAMLLKKVMTGKLIGIFFSVVTVCIILLGYVYNIIL